MRIVQHIMSKSVKTVTSHSSLAEVARQMRDYDIGILPICDGKKIQGVVTDRDIITRAIAENIDPNQTSIDKVMTTKVAYCFEDQSIQEAAEIMQNTQVRRLVVLDRNKDLSGLLSLDDVASQRQNRQLVGKTLSKLLLPISILSGFKQINATINRNLGILGLGVSVIGLTLYFGYFRQLRA